MAQSVAGALASFNETDASVRVCRAIFGAIPIAPAFAYYPDLAGAVARIAPEADGDVAHRTEDGARSAAAMTALKVTSALDAADAGLAAVSGIHNVLSMFTPRESRKRVFESDTEQAIDAGLKLLGLAYATYKLFPGDPRARLQSFLALPAGREAAIYYAVAEVSLPFADNLVEGGSGLLAQIMARTSAGGAARFRALLDSEAAQQATAAAAELAGPLQAIIGQVKGQLATVTASLQAFVPSGPGLVDSVSGAVATGLDVMPIWRFLGARLVAEACVRNAVRG